MCLIGLLGILAPRVVLIALWFFNEPFVMVAFSGAWIWPLLGLFLLPTTTLAYCLAVAMNDGGKQLQWIICSCSWHSYRFWHSREWTGDVT